jgi:hypothetical protein
MASLRRDPALATMPDTPLRPNPPYDREERHLLPSQMKAVAARVREAGFTRDQFDFVDVPGGDYDFTALVYLPDTGFRFYFYPASRRWSVEYWPGEDTTSRWEDVGEWDAVLTRVDWWLGYLRRELDVGDPWAEAVAGEVAQLGAGPAVNTPFTEPEREAVVARIEQVKAFLLEADFRAEQDRHIIIERLDYLTDATKRLGRFDWRGAAVSGVIDLAILGFVEKDQVRAVMDFLIGTVHKLLT